ncbi:hypothetical protein [Fulvivirga sedimenti]|uniref:Uncharacterized protein n=1 Tax=Fulvivirga sedimenti TaxID=2879465 RepID=A0A9X1KXB6_9BACT|nr:hypothetical protein [Fulvivirga sedimenti]MCA6074057.1 hypothetical protein [Fulvivirga sedimenti]
MHVFLSYELRWFARNPIGQIEYWFSEHSAKLTGHWDRTDEYLKTNSPQFSVKVREGRLEFKLRGEQGINPLAALPGNACFWKKWSYELLQLPPAGLFPEKTDVIEIQKERILRYTSADTNDVTSSLPPGSAGCQIEYSRISIGKNIYYSFGLEAFGPGKEQMIHELQHAANVLINEIPDLTVTDLDNADYPEKLAAL